MYKGILALILSVFLLTACHENPWRQKTEANLALIRAHILTEFPGPADDANPNFTNSMDQHYQQALVMAKSVHNYQGYYNTLNDFVNSFQDNNIRLTHFAPPRPSAILIPRTSLQFTVQHLSPTLVWISIPSFSLADTHNQLWAKKIVNLAPSLRSEKTIILDLRGNDQGDFDWGAVFLKKLYGSLYYQWRLSLEPDFVNQYRVSDYAINAVQQMTQDVRKTFGENSPEYRSSNALLTNLKAVFERGDEWYPASLPPAVKVTSMIVPQALYHGQLLLVTDAACNNSCLDFISLAKRISRVELLGQATGANTFYTHSSEPIYLDDGVELHFAYVVERNRTRASGQPYHPDKLYVGDMNDSSALQQWVLKQL